MLFTCVTCTREKAIILSELMGNLPKAVNESYVIFASFIHCGVDYAGPIFVRTSPGRGYKSSKAYIALFVCMATKAICIELVRDYTSAAFSNAFHRFCSRRGLPTDIYSDNRLTSVATTLQVANSE